MTIIQRILYVVNKALLPLYLAGLLTWGAVQWFGFQREKLQTERFKTLIENSAGIQIVPQPQTPGSQI